MHIGKQLQLLVSHEKLPVCYCNQILWARIRLKIFFNFTVVSFSRNDSSLWLHYWVERENILPTFLFPMLCKGRNQNRHKYKIFIVLHFCFI